MVVDLAIVLVLLGRLSPRVGALLANVASLSLAFGIGALIQGVLARPFERIRTLEGFITICSYCQDVRNDAGDWQQVEEYVREHSETQFSHGIWPDCFARNHGAPEDSGESAATV